MIPLLIGAGIASAAVGASGAVAGNAAANNFKKAGKKQNAMLAKDLEDMDNGALGLTPAQQAQMAAEQQADAGVQQAAQQRELARQQLGSEDFQQGAFAQANEQVAQVAQQRAAEATAGAQDIAAQIRDRRIAETRQRLDEAAARKRANNQYWLDKGLAAITGGITTMSGVPGANTGTTMPPPMEPPPKLPNPTMVEVPE